jgi:hypothetical protein
MAEGQKVEGRSSLNFSYTRYVIGMTLTIGLAEVCWIGGMQTGDFCRVDLEKQVCGIL